MSNPALLFLFVLITVANAIINGTTTHSPFTVAIFQPGLPTVPFICSGVLISPATVLTLAECVTGLSAPDLNLRIGISASNFTNTNITTITSHPDFDADTLTNDIALLRLAQNITTVRPAVLVSPQNTSNNTTALPSSVRLLGWGPTTNDSQSISPFLRQTPVATLSRDLCTRKLSPCFKLEDQHFCTLGQQEAYGDFGGPVLDPEGRVVGIISGNPTCAAGQDVALEVALGGELGVWVREQVDGCA